MSGSSTFFGMGDRDSEFKKELFRIARLAADHSGGRLRLAENEADASAIEEPEAAHFLKADGRRLGRDIEIYGLMGEAVGWEMALTIFLEEVVLPIITFSRESYDAASADLRDLGLKVFPEDLREQWRNLF